MECNTLFPGKKSKFVLEVIFSLTCFFLAGYMVCSQFLAYFANEDASVASYKMFDTDNADIYPTFSICFYGEEKLKKFRSSDIQLLPPVEKFVTTTEDGIDIKSIQWSQH